MGTIFKNVLLEDDTGGGCAELTDIFGRGNPSPTAVIHFSFVGEAFLLPLFDLHNCSVNRQTHGSANFAFCILHFLLLFSKFIDKSFYLCYNGL